MAGRGRESGDFDDEDGRKSKKKKSTKYNYGFGSVYPGVIIGHKSCNPFGGLVGYPVPANMGWLWNAHDAPRSPGMKPRGRGWCPGAVGKSMQKVMKFKLPRGGGGGGGGGGGESAKAKADAKKKKQRGARGGGGGAGGGRGGGGGGGGRGGGGGGGGRGGVGGGGGGSVWGDGGDSEPEEPLEPKPTLKINRKGDTYTIQVNPLKDLTHLRDHEDPYVDCDPLVFKIVKNRSPDEQAVVEAKKIAKEKKKRDAEIKKQLSEAVEDICKCAYMDVYCNDYSAIDKAIDACPAFQEPECACKSESMSSLSSNATWDIEYTPPFGCFDTQPKKRKHFVHVETQYVPADAGIEIINLKGSKSVKGKKSVSSIKGSKKKTKK